jgi:hypothetical protein
MRCSRLSLAALLLALAGCRFGEADGATRDVAATLEAKVEQPKTIEERSARSDEPPPAQPVPLWEGGKVTRVVDAASASTHGYVVLDLGEAWVPYIFSDGVDAAGAPLPNAYRETYLALARGEFPDDRHGERARDDKYLELYGIMPALGLLRTRFRATRALACAAELDLAPLIAFKELVVHESNAAAYKTADDYLYLQGQVRRMLAEQQVADVAQLDPARLSDRDRDRLKRYASVAPEYLAVEAAQKRLKCEGYFPPRTRYVRGALDWATRDALAEFERRHRVYSWGYLGRDTLAMLRVTPAEGERLGVLRVLTERAIHAAGVIEDGSTSARDEPPRTYVGADGKAVPVPNLVGELERRLVDAFGLQTPESTLAFLEGLGELPAGEHRLVAIRGPMLPEYYDGDMALTLEYDRGDVWYDFPYGDDGKELGQPVQRRPNVTVFAEYLDQKIPLARFGTTIGGWRSEQVGETVMWKYKESPVGPRVWTQIVASPVWLPPDSTPPRDLLKRKKDRKPDEPEFEVNYHETGPSYASAYGLVAAYHREYLQRADGSLLIGRDEGIRTHGSVDYMSIMRRHSHGCHRLHNHIAVRLMSFVLAHRPHRRIGQEALVFKKLLEYEDRTYDLDIRQGGYVFELDVPLRVHVAEGRVRGQVKRPLEIAIPKFDPLYGAYVTADGGAVQLRGGQLIDVPLPAPDGGVPVQGGVGQEGAAATMTITPSPQTPPLPPPDPPSPFDHKSKGPVFLTR